MELNYNVSGLERKRLVRTIAEYLGCEAKYLGVPSCAYQVGAFTVGKDGLVTCDDSMNNSLVTELAQKLTAEGFQREHDNAPTGGLTLQMPMMNESALANLYALVASKGPLIKKALATEDLPINILEDRLDFPWFPANAQPDEVKAYMHFVTALCQMAKTQKRINATAKEIDNEKYAFRCFLLRLGFIGAEFKAERKILLRNLSGSSAFKSGCRKEANHDVSQ